MVSEWVTKNRFDPEYLPKMQERLFFEGEAKKRSVTNYVVLLTLATIIATYGVISGSTATVIGAMIIAPLMTPIMAATLAMVLGSGNRIKKSIIVVTMSVIFVIGLAFVLSVFISPIVIGFHSNPEITSRVSPNRVRQDAKGLLRGRLLQRRISCRPYGLVWGRIRDCAGLYILIMCPEVALCHFDCF